VLNIARIPLLAAALGFAIVVGTVALAQDNSSSATPSNSATPSSSATPSNPSSAIQNDGVANAQSGQSSAAPNSSNLPKSDAGSTEQQSKAPVVDPNANTPTPATDPAAAEKTGAQGANTQNANPQEWPSPQRYEAGNRSNGNASSGKGGASLGVNVIGSEGGQGVVVAGIRRGTPAEQMGLRPRDRILSLNGRPVGSVDEFITAIRGMNAGNQIQLSIDRGGNTRDISGRLEAFREAIAVGEGPVGNIIGRAREFAGRDRNGRIGDNYRASGENMQTSYEDGSQGGRQQGNLDARLTRVEQQLDQLMRDVSEIRSSIRSNPSNSPALPNASPAGQPGTAGSNELQPTPGQPQSGSQPSSR